MRSLLKAVESVDNVSSEDLEDVFLLKTHDKKESIGYVLPFVVDKIKQVDVDDVFEINSNHKTITINVRLDTLEERNKAIASIALKLRNKNELYTLKGWRDELYTVYYPSHEPYLLVERAFSPLLGIVMYGIHVNGYIPPELSSTGEIQFWVPRRSLTKPTFPGMLDNTIAGGIGYPYGVWDTLIKESYEEAGMSEEYIKANVKSVGMVSYIFSHGPGNKDETGLIQPEMEMIFDLIFDKDTIPTPIDGETENFELLSLDEILFELDNGKFKANCGIILIDFLIRHGYITTENEPNYLQIISHLHRPFKFPIR